MANQSNGGISTQVKGGGVGGGWGEGREGRRGWWRDGSPHAKLQRLSTTLYEQEKVCIVLMQKIP